MLELEEQLRRYFDSTAPPVGIEPDDLEAIERDVELFANRRESGRRAIPLTLAAAAVFVLGGIVGLFALRSGDSLDDAARPTSPGNDIGSAPAVGAVSSRPPDVGSTMLEWTLGTVPEDAEDFVQLLSDGKTFYWVGDGLYSSPDGEVWTEVDFGAIAPTQLEPGMIGNAWAGRLATANVTGGGVRVEIVGLDGSVQAQTLSPSLGDVPVGTIVDIWDQIATVGSRGVVVASRLSVRDFGQLIESVLGDEAEGVLSVRIDEGAVDESLLVRLSDRTERIVFSDHGFANSFEFEVAPSGTIGWRSTDGATWAPIESGGPFGVDGRFEQSVTATNNGFAGVTGDGTGWFSADGRSWAELDGRALPDCCERPIPWRGQVLVGRPGDVLAAVGEDDIATLPLGAGPPRSDLRRSFDAGEAGLAYLVDIEPEAAAYDIVFSPDGDSWEIQSLPDEFGDPYCCFFDAYGVAVGRERVAVIAVTEDDLQLWLGIPTTEEDS